MINFSIAVGKEFGKKQENLCKTAINEKTSYQVLGIYGSPLEPEWHPAAAYVLLKEMYSYDLLRKEFHKKFDPWSFEFVEMSGGKTIVFVYNLEIKYDFCNGPNAFFVKKK
tara:strand:- start:461 stop:793 length:333 start_codon:yes stop_codon:yes gene_type:complete